MQDSVPEATEKDRSKLVGGTTRFNGKHGNSAVGHVSVTLSFLYL